MNVSLPAQIQALVLDAGQCHHEYKCKDGSNLSWSNLYLAGQYSNTVFRKRNEGELVPLKWTYTLMDAAIIGAGIAGLVAALTLHQNNVRCIVYELRKTADIANPGAIGLAPNALRPLDTLGLYHKLEPLGWKFAQLQFRDELDEIIDAIDCGKSTRHAYGYDSLRIVRKRFHAVLLAAVEQANITIVSGKRFSHVVSTDSQSVTFAFTDNTTATSSVLVGADGIHSIVRNFIIPGIEPEYKGSLTMAARISKNPLLDLEQTPELTARLRSMCINNGTHAAFLACPQSADGSEVAFGLDRPFPSQSRENWELLLSDKQRQYDHFMENAGSWPDTIQLLMSEVTVDDMYRSWPFYALPELQSWSTDDRRVVLIGDAAHAIPPSAGQGACMAVEDAYSLGVVLGACQRANLDIQSTDFRDRVLRWQESRRSRVDKVRTLTKQVGNARLPREQREKLPKGEYFVSGEQEDLDWLYGYEYQLDT